MAHVPLLMEYIYTICNSVSSTLALFAVFVQTNVNYLIENREEIAQQVIVLIDIVNPFKLVAQLRSRKIEKRPVATSCDIRRINN